MAVRAFDVNDSETVTWRVVAPTRRDLRRRREVNAVIAIAALAIPFAGAFFIIGVAH